MTDAENRHEFWEMAKSTVEFELRKRRNHVQSVLSQEWKGESSFCAGMFVSMLCFVVDADPSSWFVQPCKMTVKAKVSSHRISRTF